MDYDILVSNILIGIAVLGFAISGVAALVKRVAARKRTGNERDRAAQRERLAQAWWEGVNDQWKHRPIGARLIEFANPYRSTNLDDTVDED